MDDEGTISTLSSYSSQSDYAENLVSKSRISIAILVALILFSDMLVYGAVLPCLPAIVIEKLHGTPTDIGFLFGCFALGYLVATPLFAVISDKYQNRRYPMMFGTCCIFTSTLCFAWADTFKLLVLARICQGASAGASWTIGLGMLADTFSSEKLGSVIGSVMISHTVGFTLGPLIGGFMYELKGIEAPFYLCALFALFIFVGTLFIQEPAKQTQDEAQQALLPATKQTKSDRYELVRLMKDYRIAACVICTFVTAAGLSGIEPALPIYLKERYNASTSTIGAIFIALVVPSFFGPITGFLSDKYGRLLFIRFGMMFMVVSSILVGFPVSLIYYMLPSLFMFGLSNPLIHTPLMPEMGAIVKEKGSNAFAQVYALYNMSYSLGLFVGPLIAGYIMSSTFIEESQRFQVLMFIFSGIVLLCCPLFIKISQEDDSVSK